jgi:signal transduction histidine kinase
VTLRTRITRPSWAVDAALAVALAALGAAEVAPSGLSVEEAAPVLAAAAAAGARRVVPVVAGLVVVLALTAQSLLLGPDEETLSMFVALVAVGFSAGEAGGAAGGAVLLVALWLGVAPQSDDLVADLAFSAICLAMAWGAGRAVGVHRRRTQQTRDLTLRLEREREVGAHLAVVQERARVAGEVHDAVGHTVAEMLVQADAAGELLATDPAGARAALAAVQDRGRAAIAQMRTTLRVLRARATEPVPAPTDHDPVPAPAGRPWRWPARAPAALLAALVAVWIVEIVWYPSTSGGSRAVGLALAAVSVAAVAVRFRAPLAAAAVVVAASVADAVLGGLWNEGLSVVVAILLAVYAVGRHPVPHRAILGGLLVLVVVAGEEATGPEADPMNVPAVALMVGVPWAAGWLVRSHRDQTAALAGLARALEDERCANARLAVLAERTHMARELHDTVAHSVGIMIIQAAVAEQACGRDDATSRDAIAAVERVGREALTDLERLLGLLELDARPAPLAPQPTLDELDDLVLQVRRAGLPVTLRVEGTPEPVPEDIARSTYRIVQEALTNVLKHAGTAPTAVVVRYLRGALDVSIDDDGPGVTAAPDGGHGVVGMRERALLTGGELQAGPRATGGYSVHARLPLHGWPP